MMEQIHDIWPNGIIRWFGLEIVKIIEGELPVKPLSIEDVAEQRLRCMTTADHSPKNELGSSNAFVSTNVDGSRSSGQVQAGSRSEAFPIRMEAGEKILFRPRSVRQKSNGMKIERSISSGERNGDQANRRKRCKSG